MQKTGGGEILERPLDGIKVVEYGVFHAGPGGGAILGDLGAEVIKVEAPGGDPLRYWTKIAGLDFELDYDESLVFEASNRSKKGICLDIKTEKGLAVFHRLLKGADVFITNIREDTRKKLKIDYPSLSSLNARLIYALVSGYGPRGPMSKAGAFDPLGQARSGMMYVTGAPEPALMHIGLLDQTTSIAFSQAILTALFVRERKGFGQELHLSLYSTALWMQYINVLISSVLSLDPCVTSNRFQHSPLRNRFRCSDGKWIIGTHHPEEKFWATFCRATGQSGLIDDPAYTDSSGKPVKSVELIEHFDKVFAQKSSDEWMQVVLDHGLMFCPIQQVADIKDDPQALENDYMVPFEHPNLGKITIPGYPVHFSAGNAGTRSAAPRLGEHTTDVLLDLGYSETEINLFRKERIAR